MSWWSYLLIAVAVVLLYPYIRFLIKRIALLVKLKSFCKREGLILHKTSALWWLGVRKSGRCNCYIETQKSIYSIKLFPVFKSKSCVHFLENRSYYVEKFLILFGKWGGSALFSFKSRFRKMGEIDFAYGKDEQTEPKKLTQVLMFSPSCICVKLKRANDEQIISDGDSIYECLAFSVKGLMTQISKNK